jgi:acetyltransferase-like isoleucine patch superfamily enzyme
MLYPGAHVSGAVTVGKCSELGVGSQIIQCKTIGENTIIGAGAVVISDIHPNCTAVGCPAKPIKFHE